MDESGNFSQNATTESPLASALRQQGYTALVSALLVLLVPPQLFLSILTIAGLCTGKAFRKIKAQRNLMISIAAMGFVSSATKVLYAIAEYLFVHSKKEAGVIFCHAAVLSYYFNTTMRAALIATLSVTVYITVKHGYKKIKSIYLYIALVILLVIVLLFGIQFALPFANSFNDPLDGVICSNKRSILGYIGLGLGIAMLYIPTHIATVGVTIATFVFAKKHYNLLTKSKELKVAMVKIMS